MEHNKNLKEEHCKVDEYQKEHKAYATIKAKYADAIVLLRSSDEYITFQEDAIAVFQLAWSCINEFDSQYNICRFAFNALDTILIALVKAGNKVAICDQI
jgi:DNA mismatch repair ATPase MutS